MCDVFYQMLLCVINFFAIFLSICLTKMDILDSFDEIKIGVAYKLDGKVLDSMPGTYSFSLSLCIK